MTERVRWVCPICQKAYAVPSVEGLTRCRDCAGNKSAASKTSKTIKLTGAIERSASKETVRPSVSTNANEDVSETPRRTWSTALIWFGLWAVPLVGVIAAIGYVVSDTRRRANTTSPDPGPAAKVVANAEVDVEPVLKAAPPQYYDGPVGIIRSMAGHHHSVLSVAFSPDGKRAITGSADATVRTWDLAAGRENQRLDINFTAGFGMVAQAMPQPVYSAVFSPDAKRALIGFRGYESGNVLAGIGEGDRVPGETQRQKTDRIVSNLVEVSGIFAADAARQKTVRYMDLEKETDLTSHIDQTKPQRDTVRSVAFSPGGQLALLGYGRLRNDNNEATSRVELWDLEADRLVQVFLGHRDGVWSVCFSRDGQFVLSGGDDCQIILWDVKSGQLVRQLTGHTGAVKSVVFSPDGRFALSGSRDHTVRLWDLGTGKEVRRFEGHNDWVNGVAFSPDGHRLVSGSSDRSVRLWDRSTGELICRLEGHRDCVWSVSFSPDGKQVLSAGGGTIDEKTGGLVRQNDNVAILWGVPPHPLIPNPQQLEELASQESGMVKQLDGHRLRVTSAIFSPDGRRALSVGGDSRVWDLQNGRSILELPKEHSAVFSPDGRYLASWGIAETSLRLWDAETGQKLHELVGHKDKLKQATFLANGAQLVSCAEDNTLRTWDLKTGKEIRKVETLPELFPDVLFSPNSQRLFSWHSGSKFRVRAWETESGNQIHSLNFQAEIIGDLSLIKWPPSVIKLRSSFDRSFSPQGELVLTASIQNHDTPRNRNCLLVRKLTTVGNWHDIELGAEQQDMQAATRTAFSPDGQLLLTSHTGRQVTADSQWTAVQLRLWDLRNRTLLRSFNGHKKDINSIAFSPDGQLIVSASYDKSVRVWEVKSGEEACRFDHPEIAWSASFSPDGRFVLTGSGGILAGADNVLGIGTQVKTGNDNTVRLWRIGKPRTGLPSELPEDNPNRNRRFEATGITGFSYEPGHFLSYSRKQLRVQRVDNGQEVRSFEIQTNPEDKDEVSIRFSPNGRYFLRRDISMGSRYGRIRIFDVESEKEIQPSGKGTEFTPHEADFSPDGRYVVASGIGSFQDTTNNKGPISFNGGFIRKSAFASIDLTEPRNVHVTPTSVNLIGTLGGLIKRFACSFPDAKIAITLAQDALLWDLSSGKSTIALDEHVGNLTCAVVSPDGRFVLTGCAAYIGKTTNTDNTLILWDGTNGRMLRRLKGHTKRIYCVAFSPDGQLALSGSEDKSVRLWEVQSGTELRCLRGHENIVKRIAFSPDGQFALSCDYDEYYYNGAGRRVFADGATTVIWDIANPGPIQEE